MIADFFIPAAFILVAQLAVEIVRSSKGLDSFLPFVPCVVIWVLMDLFTILAVFTFPVYELRLENIPGALMLGLAAGLACVGFLPLFGILMRRYMIEMFASTRPFLILQMLPGIGMGAIFGLRVVKLFGLAVELWAEGSW